MEGWNALLMADELDELGPLTAKSSDSMKECWRMMHLVSMSECSLDPQMVIHWEGLLVILLDVMTALKMVAYLVIYSEPMLACLKIVQWEPEMEQGISLVD